MAPVKFLSRCGDPAWASCLAVGAAAVALAWSGTVWPGIGWPAAALASLAALAGLARVAARFPARRGGFGPANRITAARLGLAALLAGLLAAPAPPTWLPLALAGPTLALDGLDGAVARRTGQASTFGARFDQELDGAVMAVLAGVAVLHGPAPGWALALGAWHYVFKLAGRAVPALRAPLPPTRRRPAVCALQGVVLVVLVAPGLGTTVAGLLAAAGLTAVSVSFVIDMVWLVRGRAAARRPTTPL